MSERQGIERLRWLQEADEWHKAGRRGYPELDRDISRWEKSTPQEVMLECSIALIEELHTALEYLRTPQIVISNPARTE